MAVTIQLIINCFI